MPFCPKCKSEYRSDVTHCADDGTELVASLDVDDLSAATLTEIYATYREIEADRITSLLEDEGIACYARGLRRAAFPTGAGSEAPTRIAVRQSKVARAAALIQQARVDGIVSKDGAFLE